MTPATYPLPKDLEAPVVTAPEAGLRRELSEWASFLDHETGAGKQLGDDETADRWASAVASWVIDASLLLDGESLHAGLEVLRSAHTRLEPTGSTARLEALVALLAEAARAGLERSRQAQLADTLDPTSWSARMLVTVDEAPGITSATLSRALGAEDSQVSRSGRTLIERGLAIKTKHGRAVGWRATPRGAATAEQLRQKLGVPFVVVH
jgi:DNA-binding MarR family transcriptional regulator